MIYHPFVYFTLSFNTHCFVISYEHDDMLPVGVNASVLFTSYFSNTNIKEMGK